MHKPIELAIYMLGFLSSSFFEELPLKMITTTITMVFATTVSYFWNRFLRKIDWKQWIVALKMKFQTLIKLKR
ncbi:hypothetical protein [Aquimarina aggregata]|nr:hypothetical protein [Aquimarina aggregata]